MPLRPLPATPNALAGRLAAAVAGVRAGSMARERAVPFTLVTLLVLVGLFTPTSRRLARWRARHARRWGGPAALLFGPAGIAAWRLLRAFGWLAYGGAVALRYLAGVAALALAAAGCAIVPASRTVAVSATGLTPP
ncbi:MAG TPA: hypothetical protein VHS58_14395 [Acetobacteraceae bacterium]|jgi:hypothetical protein|nr:hypothetical protein [Acetobacteraceae bacterium]